MEIITTHVGVDFDALASMVAVQKLYPKAKICFPGPVGREVKDFLLLYEGLIQDIKIEEVDLDKITLLILVDTRWINRIGSFYELVKKRRVKIHIYDHHPSHPEDIEGDWGICKEVGATVSILTSLIKKRGGSITPVEASLFMLGIYEDTGSLSFPSTTSFDIEAVKFLLSQGANLEFVSSFLNRELTDKQIFLLNDFLRKAKTWTINGVELVVIITEIDEFIGGLSLPLHRFIDLKDLEAVFALVKSGERIYLIARSRTPSINVGKILSFFGGWGHSFAASAIIKGENLIEVEKRLYEVLKKVIKPFLSVEKIMNSAIKIVSSEISLKEAKRIMEINKLDFLPVIDKDKVEGVISLNRVNSLLEHFPGEVSIKNYLSRKFAILDSSISLKKAQKMMLEKQSKEGVVFKGDTPVGIISGNVLLSAFHRQKNDPEKRERLDLGPLLKKVVPLKIQELLKQAGRVAEELGYKAFLVGGFVRDILLGIENLDIDLVIEGDGLLFSNQFAKRVGGELKKYRNFGTATLILSDGFKLDIATSREEFYPQPASLPRVRAAPLQRDLFRRDFTVNALAMDLSPSNFGLLIDFFEGERDLREKRVKVLHSRSFIEDPTRIFRAIRFEQRYNFTIEKETQRLIKEALREGVFQKLSRERIREELIQILKEDKPEKSIRRMQEFGILEAIYPGIKLTSQEEKLLDSLIDVFAWFEVLFEKKVKKWLICLLVLLENLSEEETRNFCERYKFTREERDSIIITKIETERIIRELKTLKKLLPSFIYEILSPLSRETLLFIMAKTKEKMVKKRIFFYLTQLRDLKIEVDGNDLKKMGYKPSPLFKEILEKVRKAKLDGLVKTKKEEIDYIKKNFILEKKDANPGSNIYSRNFTLFHNHS